MVMEDMLKDFLLGEHLLLVGNQVSGAPLCLLSGKMLLFKNPDALLGKSWASDL